MCSNLNGGYKKERKENTSLSHPEAIYTQSIYICVQERVEGWMGCEIRVKERAEEEDRNKVKVREIEKEKIVREKESDR